MPIFEYQCLSCGYVLEELVNGVTETFHKCPQCKKKMKKIVSTVSGRYRFMDTLATK